MKMLFQLSPVGEVVLALIILSIVALVVFLIGVYVTKWYAKKKDWEESTRTTLIVNLIWTIFFFVVGLVSYVVIGNFGIFAFLLILVINTLVGSLFVRNIYKREFGDSFLFTLVIQVILFIITMLLIFIFSITLGLVLIGLLIFL